MKLYKITGSLIDQYAPATPAEVAAAHPKCGTCECRYRSNLDGHQYCRCIESPMYEQGIDPALDYCRHHPELNKENDDDKAG